jgi:hypothetical protein
MLRQLLVVEGVVFAVVGLWLGHLGLALHRLLVLVLSLCSHCLLLVLQCTTGQLLMSVVLSFSRLVLLLFFFAPLHLYSLVRKYFRFPLLHHALHHRLSCRTVVVLALVVLIDLPLLWAPLMAEMVGRCWMMLLGKWGRALDAMCWGFVAVVHLTRVVGVAVVFQNCALDGGLGVLLVFLQGFRRHRFPLRCLWLLAVLAPF